MKNDDLDAFVSVVRCKSLSVAAEQLGLTQSAITRRVQNFEHNLGAQLLDRQTKPLKPTAMGLRVYQQCCEIQQALRALQALVHEDGDPNGRFRLGVPQTLSDWLLIELVNALKQRFPELNTQVSNGWGNNLLERLQEHDLDAVAGLFASDKVFPDHLLAHKATDVPLLVVCSKDQPALNSLAACNAQGWILNPDGCGLRHNLQQCLAAQGLSLALNLETFGSQLQLGLVAKGLGLGLVPAPLLAQSQLRHQLRVLTLTDYAPTAGLWLVQPEHSGNLQQALSYLQGQLRVLGDIQPESST